VGVLHIPAKRCIPDSSDQSGSPVCGKSEMAADDKTVVFRPNSLGAVSPGVLMATRMLNSDNEGVVLKHLVDHTEGKPMNKSLAIPADKTSVSKRIMGNPGQRFIDAKDKISPKAWAVITIPLSGILHVSFGSHEDKDLRRHPS